MSNEIAVFLFHTVVCAKNSTPYQRARCGCEKADAHFLTRRGVCEDIAADAQSVVEAPNNALYRFFFPVWLVWRVTRLNRKHTVRFVYTNFTPQNLIAGYALNLVGYTWIADIYDSPHIGLDLEGEIRSLGRLIAYSYNWALVQLVRRTLTAADLIVVAMIPDILERYGVSTDDENVLKVTNGVTLEATRKAKSARNSDSFTLVYVGPIREVRGLDVVFEALATLDSKVRGVELRLVGDVREQDEAWLNRELGGYANVEISVVGYVPHADALAEIDRASVGLCPLSLSVENYSAAYPIKVFEYMALGKPTVATRTKGTETILTDGETGLLVSPDDGEAMANAIYELYRDADLRERLGTNASEAVEEYDWDEINSRIWERIEAVCA